MTSKQGKQGRRLKQEKNRQDVKKKLVEAVDEDSDADEVEDAVSDVDENDDSDEEANGDDDSEIKDVDEICEMADKDNADVFGDDAKEGDEEEDKEANEEDANMTRKRKLLSSPKHDTKKAKLETQKPKDRTTLYIKTRSVDVESPVIEKFFRDHQIGVIEIRRIQGKNYAYVDILTDQTEAALKLSSYKMAGKEVEIHIAREKSSELTNKTSKEKKASRAISLKKSLFVKNLPYNLSDDDIKSHFPLALNVSAKRKPNGKLIGHAFLDFESEEVAEKVMSELQNSQINGRTIALDFVGGKRMNTKPQLRPDESCKTLCVKQLTYSIGKEELKVAFKNATDARIVADPDTGKSKGFAFVSFDSHEDASNAMEKMQGKLLKGRNLTISFSRKASNSLNVASKDKGKKKKKKLQNGKRHRGRRLSKSTKKSDSS